ncbi:MAG TPA: 4-vinyl reductase, partial [Anaerolineales bacterium]|nr:4-vinyl reductase [Anaerolineales bacterium]
IKIPPLYEWRILFYPQKMGRIIFIGMQAVIGTSGVEAVLRPASLERFIRNYPPANAECIFSLTTVSLLQSTLEQAYAPRGGRGVALRTGRACFKCGLKKYGSMLGLTEMAVRLLSLPTKLRTGTKTFAGLFNKYTDQKVIVEEKDNKILR